MKGLSWRKRCGWFSWVKVEVVDTLPLNTWFVITVPRLPIKLLITIKLAFTTLKIGLK